MPANDLMPGSLPQSFRSLPETAAACFTVAMPDGVVVPVYEFRSGGGAGPEDAGRGKPPLLFGHANGFAAGSYRQFFEQLATFARVFAFDARGHGGSVWPAGESAAALFSTARFADDLRRITAAVAERTGGVVPHYAGHSLGAVAAVSLLAGIDAPGVPPTAPDWPSVTLFEPAVFPTPDEAGYEDAVLQQEELIVRTVIRQASWRDHESFCARVRGRGAFAGFSDAQLAAHAEATLRPAVPGRREDDDGGGRRNAYVLCCPPAVEAAVFRNHQEQSPWSRLGRVGRRVVLVGGDPGMPDRSWITAAMPAMAQWIGAASRLETVPETGHMLVFERPGRCAEIVAAQVTMAQAQHSAG
jgi:pimeloyl-ACP methyl ester carboxylesterase